MFIKAFQQAHTVEEAVELLSRPGTRPLAGGTDLMVQLREDDPKAAGVEAVVDLSHLESLKKIEYRGDSLWIGALVSHTQAAEDPLVKTWAPFLAEACHSVGAPQIRNRGTLGGSICNASPAADPVPPLVALDAELTLAGPRGQRTVALADFLDRPYRPLRQPDELLTWIRIPCMAGARTAFVKLGRRRALAIARMNVAVLAVQQQGVVEQLAIVPGAVFPKAIRVTRAEDCLVGQRPTQTLIEQAAVQVAAEMVAASGRRWSTPYKEPVITTLCRRALERVLWEAEV